ncbi:MAG: EAL domain-containing protein [Oscillospiraceae bacterium]
MNLNILVIVLSVICLWLIITCVALLFAVRKNRGAAKARQAQFANFDRLTGLGNKAKFTIDDANLQNLDSYAMVSIHLSRYLELYNLFGITTSDKAITKFCNTILEFAARYNGEAYRVAFDHLVLVVHYDNKDLFCKELKICMQAVEHLDISLANEKYTYDFLLLYGIYFLSDANDTGVDFSKILVELDRKVLRSTLKSAASCIIVDDDKRPDWAMLRELSESAKAAWDNHEFVSYYQPIINIYTNKVVGAELLARWEHPKFGLLLPNQFIPILEANGLILDLDLYMIDAACRKIQYWLDNGILTVPLAVNLSPLNIHRTDFIDRLVGIVTKYETPPTLLELELPERNLLYEDTEAFLDKMNYLHKKGFILSMGHFAEMDHASLWLLRKFPFNVIKVNYHFFKNADISERADIYVRNFIKLAKQLNIKIVVTQLETDERVKSVQSFGCTNGKGFCLSRPLSSDEFQEFIV